MDSQKYDNRLSLEHKKVCYHDNRYRIEVQLPCRFEDNTASWVRIMNGVDRYLTEPRLTEKEEDIASGKPLQKQDQDRCPQGRLTSVSFSFLERKWIDIETQRSHDQKCCWVSKASTRLLRHDQTVPRGSDGAIHYSDIIEECRRKKFDDASQWSLEEWILTLAKGGGAQKKVSILLEFLNSSSNQCLHLREIQGHSGENAIDPTLQDNVLLPKGFTEYIYHVGNASVFNSTIRRNGLIPGGKSLKRGRHAVFFAIVNLMEDGYGFGKLHAILRNQGSLHTRIHGHAIKILYVGAI